MRLHAHRRPGQLRLDGRRSAGGHALHRGAPDAGGRNAARATSTRTPSTSRPNYDDSDARADRAAGTLPNLLVNGASGIAVGMATNIPPHNLGEVIDACLAYIDNPRDHHRRAARPHARARTSRPAASSSAGPASREAYRTGRGSMLVRGRTHTRRSARTARRSSSREIPYQVNKARLIERIAELVQDKLIEGISDLRDESDRDGVRVVIELKRDADGRDRAQPALPLHAAADQLRRQHAGAQPRPAAS